MVGRRLMALPRRDLIEAEREVLQHLRGCPATRRYGATVRVSNEKPGIAAGLLLS